MDPLKTSFGWTGSVARQLELTSTDRNSRLQRRLNHLNDHYKRINRHIDSRPTLYPTDLLVKTYLFCRLLATLTIANCSIADAARKSLAAIALVNILSVIDRRL